MCTTLNYYGEPPLIAILEVFLVFVVYCYMLIKTFKFIRLGGQGHNLSNIWQTVLSMMNLNTY